LEFETSACFWQNEGHRFQKGRASFSKTKGIVFANEGLLFLKGVRPLPKPIAAAGCFCRGRSGGSPLLQVLTGADGAAIQRGRSSPMAQKKRRWISATFSVL